MSGHWDDEGHHSLEEWAKIKKHNTKDGVGEYHIKIKKYKWASTPRKNRKQPSKDGAIFVAKKVREQ